MAARPACGERLLPAVDHLSVACGAAALEAERLREKQDAERLDVRNRRRSPRRAVHVPADALQWARDMLAKHTVQWQ